MDRIYILYHVDLILSFVRNSDLDEYQKAIYIENYNYKYTFEEFWFTVIVEEKRNFSYYLSIITLSSEN